MDRLERFDVRPKEKRGFRTGNSLSLDKPKDSQYQTPVFEILCAFAVSAYYVEPVAHFREFSVDKRGNWEDYRSTPGFIAKPHLVIELNTTPPSRSELKIIAVKVATEYQKKVLDELEDIGFENKKETHKGEEERKKEESEYVLVKGRKGMTLKQRRPKGKKGCCKTSTESRKKQPAELEKVNEPVVKEDREEDAEVDFEEEGEDYERFKSSVLRGSIVARPARKLFEEKIKEKQGKKDIQQDLNSIVVRFVCTEELFSVLKKDSKKNRVKTGFSSGSGPVFELKRSRSSRKDETVQMNIFV